MRAVVTHTHTHIQWTFIEITFKGHVTLVFTVILQLDLNRIDPIHLKTDLDLMKERRRNLGIEIPKQQIKDKENERRLVSIKW